ncbi:hypothetical protein [Actinospica robiniae]|uniref:hypothetical protein n=1 Tax=Actinospica robiniae TaxID=304901 RepID=UPI00041A5D82|nr:hypothetical protein [Actinospica robiniae]
MTQIDPWAVPVPGRGGDISLPAVPAQVGDAWSERRTIPTVAAAVLWFSTAVLQVAWLVFGQTKVLINPVQGDYTAEISDKGTACLGFVLIGVLLLRLRTRTLGLGLSMFIGLSWAATAPSDLRPVDWNGTYPGNYLFCVSLIAGTSAGALSAAELIRRRRAEGPAAPPPPPATRARIRQLGIAAGLVSLACAVGSNLVDIRIDHDLTRGLHCCTYTDATAVTKGGYLADWVFIAIVAVSAVVFRSRFLSVAAFLVPVFSAVRLIVDGVVRVIWPVSSLYGRHGAEVIGRMGDGSVGSVIHTSLELGFWLLVAQTVVLLAAAFIRSRIRPTVGEASV